MGDLVHRKGSAREEHAFPALRLYHDRFHKSSSSIFSGDQVGTDPHPFEAGRSLWTDRGDPGRPEEAGVESLTFKLTYESLDPVERCEHHPIVVGARPRELRLDILNADQRRIDHVRTESSKFRNDLPARERRPGHDHSAAGQGPEPHSRRINVEAGQPGARTHDQHHRSP